MNEFREPLGCMSDAKNIGGFQSQRKDLNTQNCSSMV